MVGGGMIGVDGRRVRGRMTSESGKMDEDDGAE